VTDPITPPPELVQKWFDDARNAWAEPQQYVAARAAQWGADMELEACCEWLVNEGWFKYEHEAVEDLRAARRPKPPSLKERALHELADVYNRDKIDDSAYDTIRRALEALDD
jgi:hypothetical protein